MDNAFEATKNTPDSFIELNIGYNTTHSIIVITLINSCLNNPFDNNGQLKRTTKTDSRHHGYGIKSIQNTIDKYNGDYNIYYNHSTSTFHTVIIFQKIHTIYQINKNTINQSTALLQKLKRTKKNRLSHYFSI